MPPEQSNSRGSYARRGGGYNRGGGRSPWRGRSKSKGHGNNNNNNSNDEDDFEVGGARNNQYPGRLQNSDAHNNNNTGKRWERPRTSTQRNSDGGLQFEQDDANLPMVQADEIPAQARQVAPPRTKKRAANCPWIDWDVYLPHDGMPRTVAFVSEVYELFCKRQAGWPSLTRTPVLLFIDYHEQHEYIQWITEFRQYIQRYHLQSKVREVTNDASLLITSRATKAPLSNSSHPISFDTKKLRMELERQRVCVVNLKTLVHECNIPSLMDLAVHRTTAVVGCISLAAIQARHSSDAVGCRSLMRTRT